MLQYKSIQLTWLGQSGFRLKNGGVTYIDPFKLAATAEPAQYVFVTHEHRDHFSLEDLKKIITDSTIVVTSAACEKGIRELRPKEIRIAVPGAHLALDKIGVDVLPAYNNNKFRSPGVPFHPKADNKIGFILSFGDVRIYHAGDTDDIPEMAAAKGVDLALLPVSGTYVMTPGEAANACAMIEPKIAIPMHYGDVVGSRADAEAFRKAVRCRVEILKPEP